MNTDQGRQSAIDLEQDSDGIHWSIAANNIEDQQTAADCHRLRKDQRTEDIVFYANLLMYEFPWSVLDTIANKHVLLSLKKQPFQRFKGSDGALVRTVERIRHSAEDSEQLYSRRHLISGIMVTSPPRTKFKSGI